MKEISKQKVCLLGLIFAFFQLSIGLDLEEYVGQRNKVILKDPDFGFTGDNVRIKRQEESNSTTPKPKKYRPSNFHHFIQVLKAETKEDINRAAKDIGNLFNSQFEDSNQNSTYGKATTTAAPSTEGSEEENVKFTRQELFVILRRNLEGIVRLFNKEYRMALNDSHQNLREFNRELKQTLNDYFTNNITEPEKPKWR